MTTVRHAWREPLYGAICDWLRHWHIRIGWAAVLAAAYAVVRSGGTFEADTFLHAWLVATAVIGLYAFIQRRIDVYDDQLVVVHGRGGDRYRFSDIQCIIVRKEGAHPSMAIRLRSGKNRELYFGPEVSIATIINFLSTQGVECTEA